MWTQCKAHARAYRTPAMPCYVHITDFSTDPTPSTTRPLATGSHRYMVVLNYDLPRTTPHLWSQGAFSPEARVCTRRDGTHSARTGFESSRVPSVPWSMPLTRQRNPSRGPGPCP